MENWLIEYDVKRDGEFTDRGNQYGFTAKTLYDAKNKANKRFKLLESSGYKITYAILYKAVEMIR